MMAVVLPFASHLPHLRQRHDAWRERFTLGLTPDFFLSYWRCVLCYLDYQLFSSFLLFGFRATTEKVLFCLARLA